MVFKQQRSNVGAAEPLHQTGRYLQRGDFAVLFDQPQHRKLLIDGSLDHNWRMRGEDELCVREKVRQLGQHGSLPSRMEVEVNFVDTDQRTPLKRVAFEE